MCAIFSGYKSRHECAMLYDTFSLGYHARHPLPSVLGSEQSDAKFFDATMHVSKRKYGWRLSRYAKLPHTDQPSDLCR